MPSFVRGKWDAPHWVSCSGALRAGTAAAEERTDGLQQHGADNGLTQEDAVGNPGRLLPHAVLVLRGDEDRRPGPGRRGEMVEQLETRHPREPNIEDQAGMRLGHSAPEEFLRGSKGVRLKPGRAQQPFQGASEARVVLDDGNGVFTCGHVSLSQTCRSLGIVLLGKVRSLSADNTHFQPRAFYRCSMSAADAAWKISPSHSTARPNSAGDCTPIFCITWARCALTVRSRAPITSAICLLSRPRTTRAKTSRSRGVRLS